MMKKLNKEEFMIMVKKDLERKEKRKAEGKRQAEMMLKDHMCLSTRKHGRYRLAEVIY